jgi:hypothetical protein
MNVIFYDEMVVRNLKSTDALQLTKGTLRNALLDIRHGLMAPTKSSPNNSNLI